MSIANWWVTASSCNADGAFDAAYSFGEGADDEGGMVGTPEEIGAEVTRFLKSLTKDDVDTMCYGTDTYYVELRIRPHPEET